MIGKAEEITKWLFEQESEHKEKLYECKVFKQKRSLNANNYFHKLVGEIAKKTDSSHTEVHNSLIAEYGCLDADLGTVILKDEIEWQKVQSLHLRPTTATRVLDDGKMYRVYYVMRGSHTYDTAEMSKLIDGTVREAKEIGIDTLPPNEIERLKEMWRL
jgi:hypothetical protein